MKEKSKPRRNSGDSGSCKDRWLAHKSSRMTDIRTLWEAFCKGQEDVPDLGSIYDYGLSFDYVAPGAFSDQLEGYWRWQLSWGGPSDELRFFSSRPTFKPYRVEYWFLDWGDGHGLPLRNHDLELLQEIWDWFSEGGATQDVYDKECNT